ncbi:MAG: hypothetical protein PHU93_04560, partial [Candidatus Gracilibacteria bacterium]|nr:hypothetical protein [Candidatus Gracilibacteria bacterium]
AAKQRLRQELLQSYDAPLKKSNFLGIFRWITSPLVGSVLAFSFIGIITISFYSQLFFESKSVGDMPQIQSTESMKGNLPTYMKQEEYQETSNTSSPVMSPSESMNNGFGVKKYDKNGSSLDMISGKTNDVSSTLKGSTGGENSFELYQVYLLISVIIGVGLYFFILRWRKNKDI